MPANRPRRLLRGPDGAAGTGSSEYGASSATGSEKESGAGPAGACTGPVPPAATDAPPGAPTATGSGAARAATAVPQPSQNRAPSRSLVPQSEQNAITGLLSWRRVRAAFVVGMR